MQKEFVNNYTKCYKKVKFLDAFFGLFVQGEGLKRKVCVLYNRDSLKIKKKIDEVLLWQKRRTENQEKDRT